MGFVRNVQRYCVANDITMADFERLCHLSNGMVEKWKHGKNKTPSLPTLMKIQEATGISCAQWLQDGADINWAVSR